MHPVRRHFFHGLYTRTYTPNDDMMTVRRFFEKVVSKQPANIQEHLSDHALDEVLVGHTKKKGQGWKHRYMKVYIHTCMYRVTTTSLEPLYLCIQVAIYHEVPCDCSYISSFHVI